MNDSDAESESTVKKRPSGAQQRKRRKEREEIERREESQRQAAHGELLERYTALGRPPTDDPTRGLIYAQNCMLEALYEVITDKLLTARDRWRFIHQFGGQIGVTHAKTLIQAKLDKVTKKLHETKTMNEGLKSLHGITKPATARGGTGA